MARKKIDLLEAFLGTYVTVTIDFNAIFQDEHHVTEGPIAYEGLLLNYDEETILLGQMQNGIPYITQALPRSRYLHIKVSTARMEPEIVMSDDGNSIN